MLFFPLGRIEIIPNRQLTPIVQISGSILDAPAVIGVCRYRYGSNKVTYPRNGTAYPVNPLVGRTPDKHPDQKGNEQKKQQLAKVFQSQAPALQAPMLSRMEARSPTVASPTDTWCLPVLSQ